MLDTIHNQEAEIERLKQALRNGAKYCNKKQSEAIKEFAERLKENEIDIDVSYGYGREHYTKAVATAVIDNLVKEMVGKEDTK